MQPLRSLAFLVVVASIAACASPARPAPAVPQPATNAGSGDVLPPQARNLPPPARPVNPLLQQ